MSRQLVRRIALRALVPLMVVALVVGAIGVSAAPQPAALGAASRVVALPFVGVTTPPPSQANLGVALYAYPNKSVAPDGTLSLELRATNSGGSPTGGFRVYIPYNNSQILFTGSDTNRSRGDWVSGLSTTWATVTFGALNPGETRSAWLYSTVQHNATGGTVSIRADYSCPTNNCQTNRVQIAVSTNNWHPGGSVSFAVVPDRGVPGTCHVFSTDQFKPGEPVATWLNTPSGVQALNLAAIADWDGRVSFQLCTNGYPLGAYSFVGYGKQSLITAVGPFIVASTLQAAAKLEPLDTTLVTNIDLPLALLGGISGRATDQSGNDLEGVRVLVRDTNGAIVAYDTTGPDGRYAIYYGLATGQYRVEFQPASALDPATAQFGATFASIDPVQVTETDVTRGVDGVLQPGGAISGLVVSDDASMPLGRVPVVVSDAAGAVVATTVTGANGTYHVGGLGSGIYTVGFDPATAHARASHAYTGLRANAGAPVTVTAPQTTNNINGTLERQANVAQIVGRVTAQDSGAPLAEVQVLVEDQEGRTVALVQTDANGSYSTSGLAPETYTITFFTAVATNDTQSYTGVQAGPISVPAGNPVTVDRVLVRGSSMLPT